MNVPARPVVGPRAGFLARLRLTHPLRLYTWPALLLLIAAVVVDAAAAGEWAALLLAEVPALLLLGGGLWAGERSTFSPADVVRTIREATDRW